LGSNLDSVAWCFLFFQVPYDRVYILNHYNEIEFSLTNAIALYIFIWIIMTYIIIYLRIVVEMLVRPNSWPVKDIIEIDYIIHNCLVNKESPVWDRAVLWFSHEYLPKHIIVLIKLLRSIFQTSHNDTFAEQILWRILI